MSKDYTPEEIENHKNLHERTTEYIRNNFEKDLLEDFDDLADLMEKVTNKFAHLFSTNVKIEDINELKKIYSNLATRYTTYTAITNSEEVEDEINELWASIPLIFKGGMLKLFISHLVLNNEQAAINNSISPEVREQMNEILSKIYGVSQEDSEVDFKVEEVETEEDTEEDTEVEELPKPKPKAKVKKKEEKENKTTSASDFFSMLQKKLKNQ